LLGQAGDLAAYAAFGQNSLARGFPECDLSIVQGRFAFRQVPTCDGCTEIFDERSRAAFDSMITQRSVLGLAGSFFSRFVIRHEYSSQLDRAGENNVLACQCR